VLNGEFRKCDLESCTRQLRKVKTGDGGITLTRQQMLEGFGGAEECQRCGALHCDACYPLRENVCVRCGERALRLVMVRYATGLTALWPQPVVPAVTTSSTGSPWAISLRKFLATQTQGYLEAAATELATELATLPTPRYRFFRFTTDVRRRALESAWLTIQKVSVEDRSPAVQHSHETANLLRRCGRSDDADSVLLIGPDWDVRIAQSYQMAPGGLQDRILQSGLDACKRCVAIVRALGDRFCEAEYLTRLGNGLYSARRFEEAEGVFTEVLRVWRGLASTESEFLVRVGRTLQHLGATLSARAEYTRCAAAYREAIEVLESCGAERDLAVVLNNLGTFHLHRHEYENARSCFERTCSILERLIGSGVTRSTDDPFSPLLSMQLTTVRGNLALCLSELGDLERAAELMQETITEQEGHRHDWGDLGRLELAKSRSTLGRVHVKRWAENRDADPPRDELLDEAIRELSVATAAFSELLQQSNLTAHLPAIINAFISYGHALGYRHDFEAANQMIDRAIRLANTASLWFERMTSFEAKRELEVMRQRDPLAGFEYAAEAIRTAEEGMAALSEAEAANRDLVKSRVEMSYLSCLANWTRRKDYENVFHALEALRRIDRLAQGARTVSLEFNLASATALARKQKVTYIATQAAPAGTVFFVIDSAGETTAEPAVPGWAERAFEFSTEIDHAARSSEFFGEPDFETFRNRAASLFDELPGNAKRALQSEVGPIFLSMGSDQHNLPMELLFDRAHGWLGLQRVCARIRSFEELATILDRQPSTASPHAVVAAGPGESSERIIAAADCIGAQLVSAGCSLRPAGRVLTGDELSRWSFLDNIDRTPSTIVFVGHGGYDGGGPFLQLSAVDQLRPSDLVPLRFDSAPIVHVECCTAGQSAYFGGGYWNSYAVSFMAVGASCCLVSNRIIFGRASALLCEELYGQLTGSEGVAIGAALLAARRRTAVTYPNPIFWVAPVLYGNPYVRIREAGRQ
jgi:tetratricopeptide (TPR) repeat protein